jgi:hypothetical protein
MDTLFTPLKFVFNFLKSGGHLHAGTHLTFNDLSNGIPALLLSCEIAVLAPLLLIVYSPSRYIIRTLSEEERSPRGYQGGPLGIHALLSALNVIDIIGTLVQGIKARGGGSGFSLGMQNQVNRFAEGGEQYQGFAVGRGQRGGRRARRY